MLPALDWVTFDCYGTLIDWERGICQAFEQAAARGGRVFERNRVLEAYAAIEPVVEAESYRRYRDVLATTAARVAALFGWPREEDGAGFLADSLPAWPPFPDTNPALARLATAGVRLGILSNVDDDLLAGTLRHLEAPFELIVTAQQLRSYKPRHAHFLTVRARIEKEARWVHAAQSYFHDVVPCLDLAIPVAWINRKGEDTGAAGPPDHEFRDLTGLADWALSAGAASRD